MKLHALVIALFLAPLLAIPTRALDATRLIAQLDARCLGCGSDPLSPTRRPHAMAFALIATAASKLGDRGNAVSAADWLRENAKTASGATGWGLGLEWDAFSDKSINPPDTIYGITTALAVAGLADAYELTGDQRYLDTAVSALDNYSRHFNDTEVGGCFWYSDQKTDSACVHNVNAMLMGQYARIGNIANRRDFKGRASAAHSHLMAAIQSVQDRPFWHYGDGLPRPNDSVHAAYIVQGLTDYARAVGAPLPDSAHAEYLSSFATSSGFVAEFSPLHALPERLSARRARLWGVGQIIYTLNDMGRPSLAAIFEKRLDDYTNGEGLLIDDPKGASTAYVRMLAHVIAGLSLSSAKAGKQSHSHQKE